MRKQSVKILTISLVLLCSAILSCLTGCDPSHYTQNYEDLLSSVTGVELIRYDAPNAEYINTFISQRKVRAFDFSKAEIIEVLDTENLDDFLQDWADVRLWNIWGHSNSPVGISLRILHDNGDFDVFSCTVEDGVQSGMFGHRFTERGRLKEYIGLLENRSDFVDIINSYFTMNIS